MDENNTQDLELMNYEVQTALVQ